MITYRLGSARMVDAHVCVDHTEAADNGSNNLRHFSAVPVWSTLTYASTIRK